MSIFWLSLAYICYLHMKLSQLERTVGGMIYRELGVSR